MLLSVYIDVRSSVIDKKEEKAGNASSSPCKIIERLDIKGQPPARTSEKLLQALTAPKCENQIG